MKYIHSNYLLIMDILSIKYITYDNNQKNK